MRKRILDPEFFHDTELIENLDIPGRLFYAGTWGMANDAGILERNFLRFKIKIFPLDQDITPERIEGYVETLIRLGKFVPYAANGRPYLWLRNFHKHQKLEKPRESALPLPAWVEWHDSEKRHERAFEVNESILRQHLSGNGRAAVPTVSGQCPDTVQTEADRGPDAVLKPEGQKGKELELELKGTEADREGDLGEPDTAATASEEPQPTLPDLTPTEAAVLNVLKSIPNYPFEFVTDLEHLRELTTDFPDIHLVDEAKRFRDWHKDHPLTKQANPRLRLRNWCKKAVEIGSAGGKPRRGRLGQNSAGEGRDYNDEPLW